MGAWGTGIYSNDLAEDVKEACKDIFAYYEVEQGNQKIFEIYKEVIAQEWVDDNYASFWYALADWQWKHGMLSEEVKNKALELSEVYAGINDWIESGNKRDVIKRKRAIDALRNQLHRIQPPLKKPVIQLITPKHKPGDIIIFRATEFVDEWDSAWHIKDFRPPLMFESELVSESKYENISGYDAHGKYMAILCVGSRVESYSEYIPDVVNEYSEYVWYDYLSPQKPSVEQLRCCGFLPAIKWVLKDYRKGITDYISWVYRFLLTAEMFKQSSYCCFEKPINSVTEVERFNQLFASKTYSKDYYDGELLTTTFYMAFEEKNRMELLNLQVDDLLDRRIDNPRLLCAAQIDNAYNKH